MSKKKKEKKATKEAPPERVFEEEPEVDFTPTLDYLSIQLTIKGVADIMFDRFIDHSKEQRSPDQKLYKLEGGEVVIPGEYVFSFVTRSMPPTGCALRFEGRPGKDFRAVALGHFNVSPMYSPLYSPDEKSIKYDDKSGRWYEWYGAPITKTGPVVVKQPMNARPCLKLPWQADFNLTLIENNWINEQKLHNWFQMGGLYIGLGNNRPRFGRFIISKWESETVKFEG